MDEHEGIRNGNGRYSTPKEDAIFFVSIGWLLYHYGPTLKSAFERWLLSL